MKNEIFLKDKERKLLLIFAFVTFMTAIFSFVSFSINDYNKNVEWEQSDLKIKADHGLVFAVDCGPDYTPMYRLRFVVITLLLFLSLLYTKRFLLSTLVTMLPFPMFVDWFVRTSRDIELAPNYMANTPYLLRIATIYDYFVFLFMTILFLWQISILLRKFINILQNQELKLS